MKIFSPKVVKILIRLLIGLQIFLGLLMVVTLDIGRGLSLLGSGVLIALGVAMLEQLKQLRELLTYSLVNRNPQLEEAHREPHHKSQVPITVADVAVAHGD